MLEPPDFSETAIAAVVEAEYGLRVREVVFLPLGADVNTAVYRITADDITCDDITSDDVTSDDIASGDVASGDGVAYFLKLRRGPFAEAAVLIPHLLHAQGVAPVIAPMVSRTGQLWTLMDAFAAVLSPFVGGQDGYTVELSPAQWRQLGVALKGLHTAALPPALQQTIPRETFSPQYREQVRHFQALIQEVAFDEPVAAETAVFLREQRPRITELVMRAERLAADLLARPLPEVVCHGDIHAGNVLVTPAGLLYIVDWDTLVRAPKERDLMFVGMGGSWQGADKEAWFYEGYGPAEIDRTALAYYRYERIVQDIAAFSEQLLLTDAGGADRPQSLGYLKGTFLPGEAIDVACRSDTLTYSSRHAPV